uniref:Uncharacterized protein n=1 Tax=Octopus bimaculoides TaxID=37653 RepID=A0A0L8H0H3_OCTBM
MLNKIQLYCLRRFHFTDKALRRPKLTLCLLTNIGILPLTMKVQFSMKLIHNFLKLSPLFTENH